MKYIFVEKRIKEKDCTSNGMELVKPSCGVLLHQFTPVILLSNINDRISYQISLAILCWQVLNLSWMVLNKSWETGKKVGWKINPALEII